MHKEIVILLVALTLVKPEEKEKAVEVIENSHEYFIVSLRTDDYCKMNQRQHLQYIKDYDAQIEKFKQIYSARTRTISIQRDMLLNALIVNDKRLNPLEVLSDFSKECVTKFRSKIPTVAATTASIETCSNLASSQRKTLIAGPQTTRNDLQNYYTNTFETGKANCDKTYQNLKYNQTVCLLSLVAATNSVTVENQKKFASQMEGIECDANAHITKALECSFTAQNRTISLITEIGTEINRCLDKIYEVAATVKDHSCSDIYFMPQSQVDFLNITMINPFYGRNQTSDCLMLKLY